MRRRLSFQLSFGRNVLSVKRKGLVSVVLRATGRAASCRARGFLKELLFPVMCYWISPVIFTSSKDSTSMKKIESILIK